MSSLAQSTRMVKEFPLNFITQVNLANFWDERGKTQNCHDYNRAGGNSAVKCPLQKQLKVLTYKIRRYRSVFSTILHINHDDIKIYRNGLLLTRYLRKTFYRSCNISL